MSKIVVLDAGPVGLLCAPPRRTEAAECTLWLAGLLTARVRVILPEITD
jgi:hypothetical protein